MPPGVAVDEKRREAVAVGVRAGRSTTTSSCFYHVVRLEVVFIFSLLSPSLLRVSILYFPLGSYIRQSLPLEPLFHTQALDELLRGVAIETSELFRHFYDGLAKILSIAQEPQLQDVS